MNSVRLFMYRLNYQLAITYNMLIPIIFIVLNYEFVRTDEQHTPRTFAFAKLHGDPFKNRILIKFLRPYTYITCHIDREKHSDRDIILPIIIITTVQEGPIEPSDERRFYEDCEFNDARRSFIDLNARIHR